MDTTDLSPSVLPVPPARYGITAAAVFLLICTGDVLFWKVSPGASVGVFALLAAGVLIILQRAKPWDVRKWTVLCLLAGTAVQSVIEISLSNILVLAAILTWLLGEWCFDWAPPGWARWIEAVNALIAATLRWLDLVNTAGSPPRRDIWQVDERRRSLWRVVQVVTPTMVLTAVFLGLLSKGNLVLGNLVSAFTNGMIAWIGGFDLSVPRVLLWIAVGTFSVTWVTPRKGNLARHLWSHSWPEWTRADFAVAKWQSLAILAALNAVFFSANTLDVFYLWMAATLPEAISHSEYLHSGVGSLIVAVILSAVVLVGIHQQPRDIATLHGIRALSHMWIAQNFLLIAGVFLRLKLYVEAYQWSELRIYVGCFLLLVTFGFAALFWKIAKEKTLGWLIIRNFAAVFALFFVLQFLNVAGWIAEANVDQWRNDPTRTLDVQYLKSLEAPAWPALARAMEIRSESGTAVEARGVLMAAAEREADRMRSLDWRSLQIRRQRAAHQLYHRMPGFLNKP